MASEAMPDPTPEPTPRPPRGGRKIALAVLSALAGEKTPTEAAEGLGVSLTYYYTLESRALEGLVRACEPKPKGRQRTVERELEEAHKENEQLRREVRRAQALARAAQRSAELAPPARPKAKKRAAKGRRKKKKATVRALKAMQRLANDKE